MDRMPAFHLRCVFLFHALQATLYISLGSKLVDCPPAKHLRLAILNTAWKAMSTLGDKEEYMKGASIYVKFVLNCFGVSLLLFSIFSFGIVHLSVSVPSLLPIFWAHVSVRMYSVAGERSQHFVGGHSKPIPPGKSERFDSLYVLSS